MQPAPRTARRLAVVVTVALGLAACGDDNASPDTTAPDSIAGDSTTPGSSAPETTDTTTATTDAAAPETSSSASSTPSSSAPASSGTESTTETSEVTSSSSPTSATSATSATYVVVEGDTLFAIADDAGVTVDELVAANGWPDGDEHMIFPDDVITLPSGDATTAGGSDAVPEDAVSASEVLELELTDGTSTPIAEPLADGVYFTVGAEPTADDTALTLELVQFETTEACEARLAESTGPGATTDAAECAGYSVIESPSATIDLPVDSEAPVVVLLPAPPDVVDLLALETTADVWRQLIQGDGPSWSSQWLDGGAFVEITDGEVTRVEVSVIGS